MYVPGVGLKGVLFVAAWDLCSSWGSSVVVSLPIFCPPLCTKRSAKDLGLNVVVVRFGGGGALENGWNNLNGLDVVVGVSSVMASDDFSKSDASFSLSCCWILAQGSRLDWRRSNSSWLMSFIKKNNGKLIIHVQYSYIATTVQSRFSDNLWFSDYFIKTVFQFTT